MAIPLGNTSPRMADRPPSRSLATGGFATSHPRLLEPAVKGGAHKTTDRITATRTNGMRALTAIVLTAPC